MDHFHFSCTILILHDFARNFIFSNLVSFFSAFKNELKSQHRLLHLRCHNEMKSFLKKHSYFIQLHFLKMSMIRHRAVHKNKNTLSIISLLVLRCLSLNISSNQSCPSKVVLASYFVIHSKAYETESLFSLVCSKSIDLSTSLKRFPMNYR